MEKKLQSVSIVGPGKVGLAFARALHSRGYPLVALVFRQQYKAQEFSQDGRDSYRSRGFSFPKTALLSFDNLSELPKSDLIFITTPDDVIEQTAKRLAALGRPLVNVQDDGFPGAVLHTSGALSSEALAPLAGRQCQVGSIHPLVSISNPFPDADLFRGAYFSVEGDTMAVTYAEMIIKSLSAHIIHIKTDRKALYHVAAVMASPHLVALFDLAVELLVYSGVKSDDARKILLPLVQSTINNLQPHDQSGYPRSLSSALTGTFARGDVGTVERHLKALSTGTPKPPREALEVYRLLGLRSLQLAKSRGLEPKKIREITKLLKVQKPKPSKKR